MTRLEGEHDDLRAGLARGVASAAGAERGLRLAGALGRLWIVRGYWSEGRGHLTAALAREAAGVATRERAKALSCLGLLAHCQGNWEAARSFYEQSLAIYREIGDPAGEAYCLNGLGIVARAQGGLAEARALFAQSLTLWQQLGNPWSALGTLEEWAALAFAEGNALRAARLAGAAQAGQETRSTRRPLQQKDTHQRTLAAARAALGEEAFAAAWDAGRAMTQDEAVEYALAKE